VLHRKRSPYIRKGDNSSRASAVILRLIRQLRHNVEFCYRASRAPDVNS